MDNILGREERIKFGIHVRELLKQIGKIPNSAKEVFLWDLIRLANGGLYSYRISCVHDDKIKYVEDSEFVIRIESDEVNNTLSITHKGIGWTMDELKKGIGCISEDIVNNYLDTIDKYLMNGDPNPYYSAFLSEDFSLGVYSAFMVADRVVITTTRKPCLRVHAKPRDQCVWDASATDGFFKLTLVDPKLQLQLMKRGTKVTLYLKNEYLTYLDETKLRGLVDKYKFDACPYPIYVSADHEREKKRQTTAAREEDLESLKNDFEGLRELCVEALDGSLVEKVVVSDRVYDLPGYLMSGSRTYVINPRSPIIKSLLLYIKQDPHSQRKRKKVMDTFLLHFHSFSSIIGTLKYALSVIDDIDDDDESSYDEWSFDDDEIIHDESDEEYVDDGVLAPAVLKLPRGD